MKIAKEKLSITDQFLKYLNPLDIKMLDIILEDDATYFGTTKAIFLERLKYIFNQHKLSHDIKAPEIKQHKKYSNVYKLKFHALSQTIKFIIEEKNGSIRRIYNNKEITTPDEADDLTPFDMVFWDDEKPGFVPPVDYSITLYQCNMAISELETSQSNVFTSSDLNNWANKYETLIDYTEQHFKYFKFKPFRNLYLGIAHILKGLTHIEEVLGALNSFDESNNEAIKSWLKTYERIAFCEVLNFDQVFYMIDFEQQIIQYERNSNIFFTGEDFFALIKFNRLYHKYYGKVERVNN